MLCLSSRADGPRALHRPKLCGDLIAFVDSTRHFG